MRRTLVAGLASVALVAASLMGAGAATAAPPAAVAVTQGAGNAAPVFWCLTFGYFCPKPKCRDNWCS